jgi:hypothetical protein
VTAATRIPEARHPAPALPMLLLLMGLSSAAGDLLIFHDHVDSMFFGRDQRFTFLLRLSVFALGCGLAVAGAVTLVGLARTRRSPGAALAAAAGVSTALMVVPITVAFYLWPPHETWDGLRGQVVRVSMWQATFTTAVITAGLAWAAWQDRAVRLLAAAAIGAGLLATPPPPLEEWLWEHVTRPALDLGSDGRIIHDVPRFWATTLATSAGALAWGVLAAVIAHRLPRVPADAVAPRPPRRALRAFAVSLILMALLAIAAGLTLAAVIGKPASETGRLDVIIPIAVAAGASLVAAALLWLAITDVGAAASRRLVIAAALVIWCVVVTTAQTLFSQRPEPAGSRFAVFEAPWMPGMAGAVVAAAALVAIAGALDGIARHLGQRPSRAQTVVVVLALVVGAATVPWLLGFGTRVLPMDGLRIATLSSAALVDLAAWLALARSAWRSAQLPGSVGR